MAYKSYEVNLIAVKQYYERNKTEILKKRKERIDRIGHIQCACGGKYINLESYANVHFITKKHRKFINPELTIKDI